MKSPGFLEAEAHVLAPINWNLMIFNKIGINWKLFEPGLSLIVLYFDPKLPTRKPEEPKILVI